MSDGAEDLEVRRCLRCGDTFPAQVQVQQQTQEGEPVRCPSCGAEDSDIAGEPLL